MVSTVKELLRRVAILESVVVELTSKITNLEKEVEKAKSGTLKMRDYPWGHPYKPSTTKEPYYDYKTRKFPKWEED